MAFSQPRLKIYRGEEKVFDQSAKIFKILQMLTFTNVSERKKKKKKKKKNQREKILTHI